MVGSQWPPLAASSLASDKPVPEAGAARLASLSRVLKHGRRSVWLVALGLAAAGCAGIDAGVLDELLRQAGAGAARPLDEPTITAGLREALEVATDRTVAATSRENGFFGNARIKIPLPDEFERAASGLRTVGLGRKVDELELTMNRAAERAAREATPVFVNAIRQMSFADARAILSGGERAATRYFEARTHAELTTRFAPIVEQSMHQVGLVRLYDDMIVLVDALPLVASPGIDLEDYVTARALDGLFTVLGDEEARIREDPAARSTALLRRVFGGS